jgi:multidrug efflux system outer membrane protein
VVELEPVAPRLPLEAGAEEALVQEAVTRRAEFRVLDDRRRALDQELRTARLERWPKVQVAGDYGVLGQDPANALATWRIAAGATVPLWTSGRIENEAKAAALRLRQWEQERRALELAVRREIVTALLEEQAASGAGAAAARAAAAARESLELARLRYEHGVASSLDVSIAQGGLADAEEDEMRWRHAGLAARARLAWARGDVRLFLETR